MIAGPAPAAPSGGWGARSEALTIPEAWMGTAPNASVAIRSGATPSAVSAAPIARMNPSGPHT